MAAGEGAAVAADVEAAEEPGAVEVPFGDVVLKLRDALLAGAATGVGFVL